jgi:hypothetical protein
VKASGGVRDWATALQVSVSQVYEWLLYEIEFQVALRHQILDAL